MIPIKNVQINQLFCLPMIHKPWPTNNISSSATTTSIYNNLMMMMIMMLQSQYPIQNDCIWTNQSKYDGFEEWLPEAIVIGGGWDDELCGDVVSVLEIWC